MKSEIEDKLKILQELYRGEFLYPFPHQDCRKIVSENEDEFDGFIPSLDVYFSGIAGFCSHGSRIKSWSMEKIADAENQLNKSFFYRFPKFSELRNRINKKETPMLHNQLLIYDLMRLTLVDVLSEIRTGNHSQATETSQLSLVN
jgi:hypothetical protein